MKKERLTKFKLKPASKLSAAGRAELRTMEASPIDTSDIPEVTEFKKGEWVRGLFQMPPEKRKRVMAEMRRGASKRLKKQSTVRVDVDEDVVNWFKDHAPKGGKTGSFNALLRRHIESHSRRA